MIRTFYYKVSDVPAVTTWWGKALSMEPHKLGQQYGEFKFENIRLGFVLNDFGDTYEGNRGVVMFNFETDNERDSFIERLIQAGAILSGDNRKDEQLKSAVLVDPFGNEIEMGSITHD